MIEPKMIQKLLIMLMTVVIMMTLMMTVTKKYEIMIVFDPITLRAIIVIIRFG